MSKPTLAADRKRRLLLLGSYVEHLASTRPKFARKIMAGLSTWLVDPGDRELFGHAPLPVPGGDGAWSVRHGGGSLGGDWQLWGKEIDRPADPGDRIYFTDGAGRGFVGTVKETPGRQVIGESVVVQLAGVPALAPIDLRADGRRR